MNYYIFDTEAEATTAQTADYNDYIASLPTERDDGDGNTIPIDNTAYIENTTSWDSPPVQRQTDSKWVYRFCSASTAVGRIVESLDMGGQWFPEPPEA